MKYTAIQVHATHVHATEVNVEKDQNRESKRECNYDNDYYGDRLCKSCQGQSH